MPNNPLINIYLTISYFKSGVVAPIKYCSRDVIIEKEL